MSLQEFRTAKQSELMGRAYKPLLEQILNLPKCESEFELEDCVKINTNLNNDERKSVLKTALDLRSWRKGPFSIDEIFIDSEWRSFVKYNLLKPYFDLQDKVVGDVGCNNGYYMFKMLTQKPKKIIGFDPGIMPYLQFKFINHFIRSSIEYELLGVEHLPHLGMKFDTLFCLGVIYHRSDPVKMLKDLKGALNSGGEVFLDTMYIDMKGDFALTPKSTYSKISNIYFVPSIAALLNWCERANFKNIEILATKPTDLNEQRKTEWILGESLGEFLDKSDPNLTIEGYPAPKRVYLKLSI